MCDFNAHPKIMRHATNPEGGKISKDAERRNEDQELEETCGRRAWETREE